MVVVHSFVWINPRRNMTRTPESITVKDLMTFFGMDTQTFAKEWKTLDQDEKDEFRRLLAEFLNRTENS